MKVELTVVSFADGRGSGFAARRECVVKLEGALNAPPLPDVIEDGRTEDGRYADSDRNIFVSVHLSTRQDGLRGLQVGDTVVMDLPHFEPDMRPGQLSPEDVAYYRKKRAAGTKPT